MSDDVAQAAQFYLDVCREHGRAFPLRNIVVVTAGYLAAADKEAFVANVRDWLDADPRDVETGS